MIGARRKSFESEDIARLVLFGIGMFYLAVLLASGIDGDFRAFWEAGYIANQYGYSAVYDLKVVGKVAEELWGSIPVPFPYLPVFLPLFQLLARLPYALAYLLWRLANALSTVLALCLMARHIAPDEERKWCFLGLLSFPVFYNLLWAQVNVLLLLATVFF